MNCPSIFILLGALYIVSSEDNVLYGINTQNIYSSLISYNKINYDVCNVCNTLIT